MITAAIRNRVKAKLQEGVDLANEFYPAHTFTMPNIKYDVRGTTAGKADYRTNTVHLNAVLLAENEDDFVARTVPHELAHLVDHKVNPHNFETRVTVTRTGRYRRTKRNVHGPDFKFIMTHVLQADDNTRCHSYDTTNARTRQKVRHVWVCEQHPEIEMTLGPKQHKKQLAAGRTLYLPRGKGLRWGVHTFRYSHVAGQQPRAELPLAADAPAASHNRPTVPATGSKLTNCRNAFDPNKSRADNIQAFVAIGCTTAGAATYYAKIKKERAA